MKKYGKWCLKMCGNPDEVYVVISPVSNYQPHARDRLLEKVWIRWDIWYKVYNICRSEIPDSLNGYFCDNKQVQYCTFGMFLQLPIHRKTALPLLYMLEAAKEAKVDILIFTLIANKKATIIEIIILLGVSTYAYCHISFSLFLMMAYA